MCSNLAFYLKEKMFNHVGNVFTQGVWMFYFPVIKFLQGARSERWISSLV